MNPFLVPPPDPREFRGDFGSGNYYARLSQVENLEQGDARWHFEGFDAEWFDASAAEELPRGQRRFYDVARLFLVEATVGTITVLTFPALRDQIDETGEEAEDGSWLKIETSAGNSSPSFVDGPPVLVYSNLFAVGIERRIVQITRCDPATSRLLRKAVELNIPDATDAEVDTALAWFASNTFEFATVYDVGQGNAIGICDDQKTVRAYFDLGGGVLGNARTFPAALTRFCFGENPPIILSHWDYDHWSSAQRHGNAAALAATWIVPRQTLHTLHAAFVNSIQAAGGSILVVGPAFASNWRGQLLLERCTGKGRNHSGLALTLSELHGGNGKQILLPGDARYPVIPSFTSHYHPFYFAAVAPHHGADMRNRSVPHCTGHFSSRLVYSFGPHNTFSHPRNITRVDHQSAGWTDSTLSPGAHRYEVRETATRSASGLGHVMLAWTLPSTPPLMACRGAHCQLQPEQI